MASYSLIALEKSSAAIMEDVPQAVDNKKARAVHGVIQRICYRRSPTHLPLLSAHSLYSQLASRSRYPPSSMHSLHATVAMGGPRNIQRLWRH